MEREDKKVLLSIEKGEKRTRIQVSTKGDEEMATLSYAIANLLCENADIAMSVECAMEFMRREATEETQDDAMKAFNIDEEGKLKKRDNQ